MPDMIYSLLKAERQVDDKQFRQVDYKPEKTRVRGETMVYKWLAHYYVQSKSHEALKAIKANQVGCGSMFTD